MSKIKDGQSGTIEDVSHMGIGEILNNYNETLSNDELETGLMEAESALQIGVKEPSASNTVLEKAFGDISAKYNLSLEFNDFKSFLSDLANIETGTKAQKLVESKLISSITDRVILRSIVTNSILIEKSLDIMEKQAASQKMMDEVLAGMIGQIFGWVDKLQELKDKYGRSGIDTSLERASEVATAEKNESSNRISHQDLQAIIEAAKED